MIKSTLISLLIMLLSSGIIFSQTQDEIEINKVNPFLPYLSIIEQNVKNPINSFVEAEIYSVVRTLHPNSSIFEFKSLQEKAGSDPFFILHFTKMQIEKHGRSNAKIALSKAFGLNLTTLNDIFDDSNFDNFIYFETKDEIEANEKKEEEIFHQLIKRDLEPYLKKEKFSNKNVEVKITSKAIELLNERNVSGFNAYFGDDGKCDKIHVSLPDSLKQIIINELSLSEIPYINIEDIKYFVKSEFYVTIPKNKPDENVSPENLTFTIVEIQAEPKGGIFEFYDYVKENMQYPEEAKELGVSGLVHLQFVIEPDGSLTNIEVVKGIGAGCDEEAIRILESSQKWIPAQSNNENVRSRRIIPIRFEY